MRKKDLINKVIELATPIIEDEGFFLWNVDYYKGPAGYNLLIEIDRDEQISFDDLTSVNSRLNKALDDADYIKDSYFLEVSSAGLERDLRKTEHIERFVGSDALVEIKLYAPKDGVKSFAGTLENFDGKNITLNYNEEQIIFNLKEISSIKAELLKAEDFIE